MAPKCDREWGTCGGRRGFNDVGRESVEEDSVMEE